MPFPLYALDYGSRRRLRELATPAEAYDLQVAAPHFDGLQPIQKVDDHLSLYTRLSFNDNGQLCEEMFPGEIFNTNELYTVVRKLYIEKLASNHGAQLITDRFIIAAQCLEFVNCDLTARFLQGISTKTKIDTRDLIIQQCTVNDHVTLDLVCTLFKKLQGLHVSNTYFFKRTWIDTFVFKKTMNMKSITIDGASIDLLKVEESQLIKFMKAQSKTFGIYITLEDNCDNKEVQQIVDNLFSTRFWHLKKENVSDERKFALSWRRHGKQHFYTLRKK